MRPNEYQELAGLTENQDYPAIINRATDAGVLLKLCVDLKQGIDMGRKLDRLKKLVFYGKDFRPLAEDAVDRRKMDIIGETERVNNVQFIRLLHAALGLATEAGELMEMLSDYLEGHKPLDVVNAKEELGDAQWYVPLGVDACDAELEDVMQTNIDKLRARYPDKFTEHDAQNRNLDKEREILEGGKKC
jgi:NTP pyrophosphatase (non-canonical NTP hydrolase)